MTDRIRLAAAALVAAALVALASLAGADGTTAPAATATENRAAIEAALRDGGTATLPAGITVVDRAPLITSGAKLIGDARGSTLRGLSSSPVLLGMAGGMGYTAVTDVAGPVQVGDWMFRFQFGQWNARPRSTICRVTAVNATGMVTEPKGQPTDCFLRFRKAWPCGQPKEGDSSVTLAEKSTTILVGQWMYVTDGPSADAGRGEYRRVVGVEGAVIRLNQPLRMSYGPALLAWTEPLVDVVVKGVRFENAPNANPVAWTGMFKGTVGLRLIDCDFGGANAYGGAVDVISSSGAVIEGCTGGPLQLNTATDIRVERCRLPCLYAEEECQDVLVRDCVFGPGHHPAQNAFTAAFRCRRFAAERVRIETAGRAEWPPPGAFAVSGSSMSFVDCEVAASRGGASSFGGDGLVVRGLRSDGGVYVYAPTRGASLAQIRAPYLELVAGGASDANVAVDCAAVVVGQGWQAVACREWRAVAGAQPRRAVPTVAPRPTLHERLRTVPRR